MPVLLPQQKNCPAVVADSTEIIRFLEAYKSEPPLYLENDSLQKEALRLDYYQFRANEGKQIDPSWMSQIVIAIVRSQYGINAESVKIAEKTIGDAIAMISEFWQDGYLIGDRFSVADLTAAALLSPLGLIPPYRQTYPWLFERIAEIHQLCHEPLPQNWQAGMRQL